MQIAFAWNSESEKELLAMGFEKKEILLKYLEIKPTEENIAASDSFIRRELKPIHFVSTGYWTPQAKEQDSVVQIILTWRYEDCRSFFRKGFKEHEVYIRDKDHGPTVETNKMGDSQFFSMTNPPSKFVTTSYWSPGSGI